MRPGDLLFVPLGRGIVILWTTNPAEGQAGVAGEVQVGRACVVVARQAGARIVFVLSPGGRSGWAHVGNFERAAPGDKPCRP